MGNAARIGLTNNDLLAKLINHYTAGDTQDFVY